MTIRDYSTGRNLNDVDIQLTLSEAEELHGVLSRLLARPELSSVQISEYKGFLLKSELCLTLDEGFPALEA
ncbi:MAG: hypothetical protein KDC26_05230 [Armatimonadetes bacterium]|nr:hypothetical protein [Armatimonadota bacterium]